MTPFGLHSADVCGVWIGGRIMGFLILPVEIITLTLLPMVIGGFTEFKGLFSTVKKKGLLLVQNDISSTTSEKFRNAIFHQRRCYDKTSFSDKSSAYIQFYDLQFYDLQFYIQRRILRILRQFYESDNVLVGR